MQNPDDRIEIRRASARGMDRVLDLLTEYGQPRSFFEPWYAHDPLFRPEDCWLLEVDGELVANVRVFPREVRWTRGATRMVAGIGNVITARSHRGQGYARLLMETVVGFFANDGYAASVLWTHIPDWYTRFGYQVATETTYRLDPGVVSAALACPVHDAGDEELDSLVSLQGFLDRDRPGTVVRDAALWRASDGWFGARTVVAGEPDDPRGYMRFRTDPAGMTEVLELAVRPGDIPTARALLGTPASGPLDAVLPQDLAQSLGGLVVGSRPTGAMMVRATKAADEPIVERFFCWPVDSF